MRPLIPYFDHPTITIPLPWEVPWPGGATDELVVYGFGVMVAMAFLVGTRVTWGHLERHGQDGEDIHKLVGWLVVGTFVGGHLGYAFMYHPAEYLADPIRLLHVWDGLSSFGGIITSFLIVLFYIWIKKLPVWRFLDAIAHGMAIGWALGRTGCFLAHDHPGSPTEFFLGRQGICLSNDATQACHDLGMYEALFSYGIFVVILILDRKPLTPGFQAMLVATCYGPVRFLMDFLRPESTDPRWFLFTAGQWWALAVTVVAGFFLYRRIQAGRAPATAEE